MTPPFRFLVVGMGDTFTDRHVTSFVLLLAGDGCLLVDCPDTFRKALREAAG